MRRCLLFLVFVLLADRGLAFIVPNATSVIVRSQDVGGHSASRVPAGFFSPKRLFGPVGFFFFKPRPPYNATEVNCPNGRCRPTVQLQKRVGVPLRTRRPFDIPQIECPVARDGSERVPCPSPDHTKRYRCIEDRSLCDGFIDCPNAEDEDMRACMFYKTTKVHLDVLADALLRWARGRY